MRVLYQLFMRDTSDRLPATAWGDLFYFYRRFSQTWKSLLLFEGVMGAASLISYLLSSLQKAVPLDTSPSWLQAGFVFFSLLFLCAVTGILCRLLTVPYIFFHDEQTPPMQLLKKSISYTAGYFGFILGFVLSMCLLALIFPVLFGLLAASGIWVSPWGLWTANLLFSVLILPYILLAIAGLASVFMPTEKELAKQRKRG